MSWNHGTYGWEAIEGFMHSLDVLRIPYEVEEISSNRFRGTDLSGIEQPFRKVKFTQLGVTKIAEEYLYFKSGDCDGHSQVSYTVYDEGCRPEFYEEDIDEDGSYLVIPANSEVVTQR